MNIIKGERKRVVIVGGGFGGLTLAKKLRKSGMQVVLIDKHNYHQFQPLIYQVASAGMEQSSISFPFRKIFQRRGDFFFRKAEAMSIDKEAKTLTTSIGDISYDYLVLCAGATTNYYGNAHIMAAAMPMKSVVQATAIRNAILTGFETAVVEESEAVRQELLNIVIVGGGATGVELAGVISEMKRDVLPRDYPDLDSSLVSIYLIQGAGRLLPAMAPESSAAAERYLREMGVDVILNKLVTDYKDHKLIMADGSAIATRTVIWVSGITGVRLGGIDDAMLGKGGRIIVDAYNQVPGCDGVFAIGDQAIMTADESYPNGHPQLAQVAIQQGKLLASNLKRIENGEGPKPFHYKNFGTMATVGRNKAVAELKLFNTQGFMAWVLWLVVHLRSILGVRNKVIVLLNWMWNYFNYNQSLRIIFTTGKAKRP